MLVLSRNKGESVVLGDDVTVTVVDVRGGKVRLSFDAPRSVSIHRKEVYEEIQAEKAKEQNQHTGE